MLLSTDKMKDFLKDKWLFLSSGLWTFLWFVGFCYLTNKWASTDMDWVDTDTEMGRNNVQAAIAFSFFSICSWVSNIFYTFKIVCIVPPKP
jgi:hypothetical protein